MNAILCVSTRGQSSGRIEVQTGFRIDRDTVDAIAGRDNGSAEVDHVGAGNNCQAGSNVPAYIDGSAGIGDEGARAGADLNSQRVL